MIKEDFRILHVVTTGAYYLPVVTTWKIFTTGASYLTTGTVCTGISCKKKSKRELSHSVDLQSAAATLVASLWRKVCLRSPTGAETQNTGNSGYFPLGPWLMRNTFAKKRKQIGVEEHLT